MSEDQSSNYTIDGKKIFIPPKIGEKGVKSLIPQKIGEKGEKSLIPPKIGEKGYLESLLKEILKKKECKLEQILRKNKMKVKTDFEPEEEQTLINKSGRSRPIKT